jgi:hypothetical protein
MSAIFDQGGDTEITPWSAARMRTVMAAFKAANDDEMPDPDEEVSVDQLAALEFKLATGAAPCPDFGVWRPFGARMARALKLTAHHLTPGGDYVPDEVPGPPDFAAGQAAFRVFSTAMRALGAATQTRLGIYAKKIEKFNETYGALYWWLIGMGSEGNSRAAPSGSSHSQRGEAHAKTRKKTIGGGSGSHAGGKPSSRSASAAPTAASRGSGKGRGKAKQPDGRFRVDTNGAEICWNWNKDQNGCAEICAAGRAHVCEWCRSPKHRSFQCPQKPPGWQTGAS